MFFFACGGCCRLHGEMLMFSVFLSASETTLSIPLLLVLGWSIGLLSAFFGVGGGWIVTPALNLLGMPIGYAVGTGISFLFGTSVASASQHRKHNNVEWKLAPVGIAMLVGLEFGKQLMLRVDAAGHAEPLVGGIYILLLTGLGSTIVYHSWRGEGRRKPIVQTGGHRLHGPEWPPIVKLNRCNQRVSLWYLSGVGLSVGFLSGIIGVGGGFVLVPIFVYGMGVPVVVAVGTSLLCVSFGGLYGTLTFALAGRVEYAVVGLMLLGALLGIPIGIHACRIVHANSLRLLFGIMLLMGGLSIIARSLGFARLAPAMLCSATVGMVAIIIVMALIAGKRNRKNREVENRKEQMTDETCPAEGSAELEATVRAKSATTKSAALPCASGSLPTSG